MLPEYLLGNNQPQTCTPGTLSAEKAGKDLIALSRQLIPTIRLINEYGPTENSVTTTAHLGNDLNFLRAPGFRRQRIACPPLDGALGWRPDGMGFRPEIRALAKRLGYG